MKIHLSKMEFAHKVTGSLYHIKYRPGTSDEQCITEVVVQECYAHSALGFRPQPGEHWLDLGANIGAFTFWCRLHDAHCTAYEPDVLNFRILQLNAGPQDRCINMAVTAIKRPTLMFYSGVKPGDFYRQSYLAPATIREMHEYKNIHVSAIKDHFDGVKMDIEGSEFHIIDQGLIPKCDKLVLEYHLSHDKDMNHFRKRIKLLRKRFKTVYYIESMDQQFPNDQYPGKYDRYVWCKDPR